jgi:hypothetical protein
VYPLTEDVLPGDVFLASRQIQQEQLEYEEKGFLPLARRGAQKPNPSQITLKESVA